ncbi:CcdB family protein [Mesorhizobium sp. SB112]|uniref:CcdB family protein n=1 Tax=Mesorhizobium sp. SB112 TaxID=3151853 RepID=UPI003267D3F9
MARYDVYPNPNGGFVVDVQADLLDGLKTQIGVPLLPLNDAPKPARRLTPVFAIDGEQYVLVTQFLAPIPLSVLVFPIAGLARQSDEITAALDMAFHGF